VLAIRFWRTPTPPVEKYIVKKINWNDLHMVIGQIIDKCVDFIIHDGDY
jgi:hypothetical protein